MTNAPDAPQKPEAAQARLDDLSSNNVEWGKKLKANDTATVAEWHRLTRIASGMAPTEQQERAEPQTIEEMVAARDQRSIDEAVTSYTATHGLDADFQKEFRDVLSGKKTYPPEVIKAAGEKRDRLMKDANFVKLWRGGDVEAGRQMFAANLILSQAESA
jgi:hypothetical protein